jgi:hypothetical protein
MMKGGPPVLVYDSVAVINWVLNMKHDKKKIPGALTSAPFSHRKLTISECPLKAAK